MTDTAELIEPCPHCGPGQSIVELGQFQLPLPYWQVICGACGASSGTIPEGERWPNARQLVLEGWNKRYYASRLASLQEEVERLHSLLGELFLAAYDDGTLSVELGVRVQSALSPVSEGEG